MKKIFLFLFLISQHLLLTAQEGGQWIWKSDVDQSNVWMAFRKSFTLDQERANVPVKIAVDSKYWLWINGELIIREGALKRTPNPTDTYVDSLNIGQYLKKGKNQIALLVWYWGKEGHGHNGSGKGGLYFEAKAGKQLIASNDSWKIQQHAAFDTALHGTQPYRPLAEFNVVFDARKDMPDWYTTTYDDSKWSNAKTYGLPPTQPWGKLVPRIIPQWKDYGMKEYLNKFPATTMGNILPMKLPYNAQVQPYMKIKAPAGMVVDIRTDFYTDGGSYNVRAEYVTKEGVQEFECPGWMSGEYVWYTFPAGVEIISLQYRETGYNTEFAGKFNCDDPFYNTLWEKALRTLYVNMRDNFMDCPTRERAMWWGDVVLESVQSYYVFSTDIHSLTRKAILELANWQTPEGIIYSPIPGPHPPLPFGPHRELPLQSLAAISELSFGNYYKYTGDAKTLASIYPHLKKYLSIWKIGADGLVVHRDGKWNWQDWGHHIDVPLLDNAWYYSALKSTRNIAVMAGKYEDTLMYARQIKSIEQNFNKTFWTGKEYRSSKYKGETDERGHAMAVLTGLADKENWPAIIKVLEEQLHASPYMEKFVQEALFKMNEPQKALTRMRTRYQEMVLNKTTTLGEGWDLEKFSNSKNHGWSGGPLSLLMQYVGGIEPITPGYKTFAVHPQLGALNKVDIIVPGLYGNIAMKINKQPAIYSMELVVPSGTIATVVIPAYAKNNIKEGGLALSKNKKVKVQSKDNEQYILQVTGGTYSFTSE